MLPDKITPDAIMCHDWAKDEFSRGLWCAFAPGFGNKYFDALQRQEGRVCFASAD
jgi:pseudooxynicotine oxidase